MYNTIVAIDYGDKPCWPARQRSEFLWPRRLRESCLGKHEDAIGSFDRALAIKPDTHQAWDNRGRALVRLGKYEEAIASFDRVLEMGTGGHEAWLDRGRALIKLGRNEDALASFESALEVKSDDTEALDRSS